MVVVGRWKVARESSSTVTIQISFERSEDERGGDKKQSQELQEYFRLDMDSGQATQSIRFIPN